MAKKLSTVLAETRAAAERTINDDEAAILAKIGMSGAEVNDKARRAMNRYLKDLSEKKSISDEEAEACLSVLRQSATSEQKILCNKVIAIYVSKFEQPEAAKVAKETAVTA